MNPQIFFRADGNSTVGLGHVVRSLALLDVLNRSFECIFVIKNPSEPLINLIKISNPKTIVYIEHISTIEEEINFFINVLNPLATVVLDGYHFDSVYQKAIKDKGCKLVCIDDIASVKFYADYIINHCGGDIISKYNSAPYTAFCLGPAYALLRTSFRQASLQPRNFSFKQIFINMGGADPNNDTLSVLKKIAKSNLDVMLKVNVLIGSAYLFKYELENYCLLNHNYSIQLFSDIQEEEVCSLMKSCGIAVCSASTVAYEYASVGGILCIIKTQKNQEDLYNFLIENDLSIDFNNDKTEMNSTLFHKMLYQQRNFFDGNSGSRLLNLFSRLELEKKILLRNASIDDIYTYFNWANDTVLRKYSVTTSSIDIYTHSAWFNKKLADNNCFLYVAEIDHKPVGNIRFDCEVEYFTISYMVDESYRGKGLGLMLIKLAIEKIYISLPFTPKFKAIVSPHNIASLKIFEKMGFKYQFTETMGNEEFLTFFK